MSQQPLDDRTKKLEVFLIDLLMALSHDQTDQNIKNGSATLNKFCNLLKTNDIKSLGAIQMLEIPSTVYEKAVDLLQDYGVKPSASLPFNAYQTTTLDVLDRSDSTRSDQATLDITSHSMFPSSST